MKDKKFDPVELNAPANARIVIHVTNKDSVAMEFESKSLKVEKVVAANGEGIVRVGPLKAGQIRVLRRLQSVEQRHAGRRISSRINAVE